jgi:hypothetical protein
MWNAHPRIIMPHECHFLHELYPRYAFVAPLSEAEVDQFVADLYAVRRFDAWKLDRDELRTRLREVKHPGYAQLVDAVYRQFAAQHGKAGMRWGDKNTYYICHIPTIAYLFPNARFVHIIRDGRGAVASMVRLQMGGYALPDGTSYDRNEPMGAAQLWKALVVLGTAEGRRLGPARYLEIKYETLLLEPERVCRELCEFVGEEFSPAMLEREARLRATFIPESSLAAYHENTTKELLTDRVENWKGELSSADLALVEHVIGDALERYGYRLTSRRKGLKQSIRLAFDLARHQRMGSALNGARRVGRLVRRQLGAS